MIILEKPYVSDLLINNAESSGTPILQNAVSEKLNAAGHSLCLLNDADFLQAYRKNGRLYTMSENALEWIYKHLGTSDLVNKIELLKDKASFRDLCSRIYPDFFFKRVDIHKLYEIPVSDLKFPLVLKPTVGFLSAGVYVVRTPKDWANAIEDIKQNFERSSEQFPEFVIGHNEFLLEEYIRGDEFAVDAYFDNDAVPVILNIFHHRFASETDVSDRLYCTSKAIFDKYLESFTQFLKSINAILDLKRFPMHIEFRYDGQRAIPIEINPMRFAGFCLNELQCHISGIHPVMAYLNDIHPDYQAMWKGKENDVFSFLVLERPTSNPRAGADIDKFKRDFSHILEFREITDDTVSVLVTLFTQTDSAHLSEIDHVLTMNMSDYVKK